MKQEKSSVPGQEPSQCTIFNDPEKLRELHDLDWTSKEKEISFENIVALGIPYYMQWAYERLSTENKGAEKIITLDVGCGNGQFEHHFDDIEMDCFDTSKVGLSMCVEHCQNRKVPIGKFHDKIEDLPFNRYSNIIILEVLEHMPHDKQFDFLMELKRHARKGAKMLITVPIKGEIPDPLHIGERKFYGWYEMFEMLTSNFRYYNINKKEMHGFSLNIHAFELFLD